MNDTNTVYEQKKIIDTAGNYVSVCDPNGKKTHVIYRIFADAAGNKTPKFIWLNSDLKKNKAPPIGIYHQDGPYYYTEKYGSLGSCYEVSDIQFLNCIGFRSKDGVFTEHPKTEEKTKSPEKINDDIDDDDGVEEILEQSNWGP